MMTRKSGQDGNIPEDRSRRDFARTALAAGGALLISPKLMAAPQTNDDPIDCSSQRKEIYTESNSNFVSKYVYLYHVLPTGILAYFTERPDSVSLKKMGSEINNIMQEIKDKKIKASGFGLGDIRWRFRSYIVIIYDESDELIRGDAVTFHYYQGGGAHTFRDGTDLPATGPVKRFFCANRMERKGGGDVGYPGEQFWIHLNHTRRFERRGHSDTGTNTGPPLG